MTIHDAFTSWVNDIKPLVVAEYSENDYPALAESWHNYTDSLCKDGELTDLQYHYCPAYDDAMPADEDQERDHILDALGVTIESEQMPRRDDVFSDQWDETATHWKVTISRMPSMRAPLVITYSMGNALTGTPDRADIIHCLLTDWQMIGESETFEEYCAEIGADEDSRKAERQYLAARDQSAAFAAMFSDVSLDDITELFTDY